MTNLTKTLFLFVIIAASCRQSEEISIITREEILTSDSIKYWKKASASTDTTEKRVSCKISSVQNSDNYWIFGRRGFFSFDQGKITEHPTDKFCKDQGSFIGNWSLAAQKDSLIITSNGRITGTDTIRTENEIVLQGYIYKINSSELILITEGQTPSDTITFKRK